MKKETEVSALKEEIYTFIEERGGGVSFVEIQNKFGRGECDYVKTGNLVLWIGLKEEVINAIEALNKEKRIAFYPTHILTYSLDGVALKLPIVKKIPKKGYRAEHWLPVVLYTKDQIRVLNLSKKEMEVLRDNGYKI